MNNLATTNDNSNPIAEYKGMLQRILELGIGTSEKVDALDGRIGRVEGRMNNIEHNEEITYEQQTMIDSLISKRVYQVLEINTSKSRWTEEEHEINEKYGRLFRRRLRSEVANKGHLAFPFRTTSKGNYDRACRDIEAWIPRNGVEALKEEADKAAEARRIAREQGYCD